MLVPLGQLQLSGALSLSARPVQPTSLCPLQAQLYTGGLPAQQTLPIIGEKQHQVLRNVLDNLTNVMNGYCLPEPYFKTKVGARRQLSHPVATRLPRGQVRQHQWEWAAPPSAPTGEGMGGTADEDPAGPCAAPAGAAGDHDEHFGKNPAGRGEVHPEGDGAIRQQHHLRALPLPQPAGEWQKGPHVLLTGASWELLPEFGLPRFYNKLNE